MLRNGQQISGQQIHRGAVRQNFRAEIKLPAQPAADGVQPPVGENFIVTFEAVNDIAVTCGHGNNGQLAAHAVTFHQVTEALQKRHGKEICNRSTIVNDQHNGPFFHWNPS